MVTYMALYAARGLRLLLHTAGCGRSIALQVFPTVVQDCRRTSFLLLACQWCSCSACERADCDGGGGRRNLHSSAKRAQAHDYHLAQLATPVIAQSTRPAVSQIDATMGVVTHASTGVASFSGMAPSDVMSTGLHRPKSDSFTCPAASSSRLSGLMSLLTAVSHIDDCASKGPADGLRADADDTTMLGQEQARRCACRTCRCHPVAAQQLS